MKIKYLIALALAFVIVITLLIEFRFFDKNAYPTLTTPYPDPEGAASSH